MTAPKNAILPGQNWGLCPKKCSQNCRPTSSNFGCFESLIFTKFWASQDRFLVFQFLSTSVPLEVIFSSFHHLQLARRARRLPDVPCPTSARRLPDVCLLAKKSKRLAQPFFCKIWAPPGNGGVFFEKNLRKKRENLHCKTPKKRRKAKAGFGVKIGPVRHPP